jgi:hypothetical protein
MPEMETRIYHRYSFCDPAKTRLGCRPGHPVEPFAGAHTIHEKQNAWLRRPADPYSVRHSPNHRSRAGREPCEIYCVDTATLTPLGFLQFETGGLGALTSWEFGTRIGNNQVTKLTMLPQLDLFVQTEPYVHSSERNVNDKEIHPAECLWGHRPYSCRTTMCYSFPDSWPTSLDASRNHPVKDSMTRDT